MATNDIIATAGLDISQFKASANAMAASAEKAGKAIENVGTSGKRNLGQVSLQAQDIAVQLQSGTNAATILAQQGSQLASIFGPHGAIIGGAIAIGAAIFSWATGTKDATEAAKELDSALETIKRTTQQIADINFSKRLEAATSMRGRLSGKDAAENLRDEIEAQKELVSLQEQRAKTESEIDAANKGIRGLKALIDSGKATKEAVAQLDVLVKKQAAFTDQLLATKDAIEAVNLARDEAATARRVAAEEKAMKDADREMEKSEKKRMDAIEEEHKRKHEAAKVENQNELNAIKLAEDARKKAAKEHNEIIKGLSASIEDTAKKLADVTKDAAKDAISMAKEAQRIADDAQQKAKDAVEDKIAEELKTPQQRREDRKAQKDREKAIRSIDARERSGAAARARGAYGQKNVFAHSPSKATAMAEKALQARALQNITAATLVVGSVTHK